MIWYWPKPIRVIRLQELSLKELERLHRSELRYMLVGQRHAADMIWREIVMRAGGLG